MYRVISPNRNQLTKLPVANLCASFYRVINIARETDRSASGSINGCIWLFI